MTIEYGSEDDQGEHTCTRDQVSYVLQETIGRTTAYPGDVCSILVRQIRCFASVECFKCRSMGASTTLRHECTLINAESIDITYNRIEFSIPFWQQLRPYQM